MRIYFPCDSFQQHVVDLRRANVGHRVSQRFPGGDFSTIGRENKSTVGLGIRYESDDSPEPRACVNLSAATTSRVSATRTVTRVEEIEDESDGEAAAAVDSEDERSEQVVLL